MGLGSSSTLAKVIHPKLMQALPQFYPAVVTIQVNTPIKKPDNSRTDSWADVESLKGLKGSFAINTQGNRERRLNEMTEHEANWILDLQGYYPEITDRHRAVIVTAASREVIYSITSVKADSHTTMTRLELDKVTS